MSVKNLTFMAFAKGEISSEGANFKRYIGVGSVQLLGISPTKAQLEGILNTTLDNEPSYVSEVDRDGKKIPSARVELVFKTVPENNDGIEDIIRVSLFVNKEYRFNRDNTKVQVMDIYGRTAWVTQEQLKNHEIPMYSNGPANLDKDYRPVFSLPDQCPGDTHPQSPNPRHQTVPTARSKHHERSGYRFPLKCQRPSEWQDVWPGRQVHALMISSRRITISSDSGCWKTTGCCGYSVASSHPTCAPSEHGCSPMTHRHLLH
jgi:hypothetical protein